MNAYKKYIAFFIVSTGVLSAILISTKNVLDDGPFYAQEANILIHQGFIKNFPWLPDTILGTHFGGIHFLFSYLLVPFVALFGTLIGAEVGAAFFCSAMLTFWYILLCRAKVPYASLWTIFLLFCSFDFLYRMILTRPLALSALALLALYYCAVERKYLWLLITAFLFTLSYDGAIISLVLLVPLFAADILYERTINFSWLLIPLGIVLGYIINPYFPANIQFLHFAINPITNSAVGSIVEWSPISFRVFFENNILLFCTWAIAQIGFYYDNPFELKNRERFILSITSLIFFFLMLMYRRFVDYWIPFELLFTITELYTLSQLFPKISRQTWTLILIYIGWMILGTVSYNIILNYRFIYKNTSQELSTYEPVMTKLQQISKPGSLVFNVLWPEFPRLFYFDSNNSFATGLDPAFLYKANPQKFWIWHHIFEDEPTTCTTAVCSNKNSQDVVQAIQTYFNPSYVLVDYSQNSNTFYELKLSTQTTLLSEAHGIALFSIAQK